MLSRVAAGVSKSDDVLEDASSDAAGGSIGSSSSSYPEEPPEIGGHGDRFGDTSTRDVDAFELVSPLSPVSAFGFKGEGSFPRL